MEWFILFFSTVIALLMALIESIRFNPTSPKRLKLLPLYFGMQRLLVTMLVIAMVAVLLAGFEPWLGLLIALGTLLLVGVVVSMGLLVGAGNVLQKELEPYIWKIVQAGGPVFRFFAPRIPGTSNDDQPIEEEKSAPVSKEQLSQMLKQNDGTTLVEAEKSRVLSALHFGDKTIADVMVKANQISIIDESEPMGPLLLDKLHKTGHQVIVVVKKDINHITGLLYMSDLVPLDPDIKDVADATRPKVHYVPANAPLSNVLAASMRTGKQLFVAVDTQGKTVGLITLADVLEHALGNRLQKDATVGTDPKKLNT